MRCSLITSIFRSVSDGVPRGGVISLPVIQQAVHSVAGINQTAVQIDLSTFGEPKQARSPSTWMCVAISSTPSSQKPSSTPFGNRTCSVSAINGADTDGIDGRTGVSMSGTNAGKAFAIPALLSVGPGVLIEAPSIVNESGPRELCGICGL